MKKQYVFLIVMIAIASSRICSAQELILYKQIDTTQLFLEIHYPPQVEADKTYPAMVFFFGGGWNADVH